MPPSFVGAIMIYALASKTVLELNVIAERNPLYVQLSDGGVRNTYTVKILNKRYQPRTFALAIEDIDGARMSVLGMEQEAKPQITVVPDDLREIRAYVTLSREALAKYPGVNVPCSFVVTDTADGTRTVRHTQFQKPAQ